VVDGKHEEGFPNTFLQAWAMGVPVVSLISDPDTMIAQDGLGRCSRTYQRLVEDVREMLAQPALLQETGRRCKEVVQREFEGTVTVDRYVALFSALLGEAA
jgi:glycosyltransferase involved in cell wall biosynthesis